MREDSDPDKDFLLSPLNVPQELLKQFPPVRMMVGTNDPLRDLSFLFLDRCVKAGVDARLTEFAHLPHGFLNYGVPVVGMREVSQ